MRGWFTYLTTDTRGTWIGHSLVTLGCGLIFVGLAWYQGSSMDIGFAMGCLGGAVYYTIRETMDTLTHQRDGDYDELQKGGLATSRADRVGDMLGSWCLAAGALLTILLGALG